MLRASMDALGSEIGGLFDDPRIVVLSAENTERALAAIGPAEASLVARAVDKRKREFATARVLAREALARLGHPATEILSAPDRAPIWPPGIAGSISHCDTRAVVAVGPIESGTVGVDVEHRPELKRDLWRSVFLPEEIASLEALSVADRGRVALVLFSAKEALYKAQYPWTSTFMGFHELEVTIASRAAEQGELVCTFRHDVGRFAKGTTVFGRFRFDAFPSGEVVTAVHVR